MNKTGWDSQILGFIIGLLGPVAGFWVFYLLRFSHRSPLYYWEMFWRVKQYQSPMLALSLIMNAVLLWLVLRIHWYKAGRGILWATFLYVPWVVYLYFRAYGLEE